MITFEQARYPIGPFIGKPEYTLEETASHIKIISKLPRQLKKILGKIRRKQLDKSYREGGWTVRQIVHHLADSHIHAYARMKLAVTEPTPIIKTYEEKLWAETPDSKHGSVKSSLGLLESLHDRWTAFLSTLSQEDLEHGYFHPETQRLVLLQEAIASYAWHCKHHLAHIKLVTAGIYAEATKTKKKKKSAKKKSGSASAKRAPGRPAKTVAAEEVSKTSEPTEPKAKRGPGRPPKAAATKTTTTSTESKAKRGPGRSPKAAATKTTTTSTESKAKRGPGRPPKAAVTKTTTTSTESKSKRGPGRPPKATATKTTTTSTEPKTKRSPGRPPKASTTKTTTTSTESKTKRGPGRPPKKQ